MSGGAESSILPSLNSDVSALSAPKSRDIARNSGESASFASVLDSQSPPKSPPSGPAASSNAQTNDSRSGKGLPPKAENTAASGSSDRASQTTTDDTKRLVAELADFQANASGPSFGSLVSGQAVDSQSGNALALNAIQAANLSDDLSLAADAPFTVSELLNRSALGDSQTTSAVGSSDAVPGLSTALTTGSTTGSTTGDVSSANRAADLVLGRATAIANSLGQAHTADQGQTDALLNARTAAVQPELAISQASANILGTSQVSKYSQTKAGESLSQDGVLAKQMALDTGDISFDAMLLKQGRAITPSETIDRMLALHARQEGQPAISSASATGAAPLAVGHTGAPSPTGHQAAGTGALADQFALYHSPAEPEFAEEFTARVQMMAKDGLREARLQLHPAELGRLQVSVTTEGDQARVTFVAETSAARDLIEQNLPRLREMLEEQGLQLAQSDVGQSDSEALADQDASGASNAVNAHQQDTEVDAELAPAMLAYASTTSRIDIHV